MMQKLIYFVVIMFTGLFGVSEGMQTEHVVNIETAGKKVTIFRSSELNAPLVLMNEYSAVPRYDISSVWKKCHEMKAPAFSLAVIGKNFDEWNDEMSPWPIPALSERDKPCTGNADKYLELLTKEIIPAIEEKLSAKPKYIALAGYSLAGLFAVYSMYRTDMFDRIASASGSFWYPGFVDYVKKTPMQKVPQRLYLSLGDQECKAGEKILQSVQSNTENLAKWFSEQGIETIFELNPGNHFQKGTERMAKGIVWMLRD